MRAAIHTLLMLVVLSISHPVEAQDSRVAIFYTGGLRGYARVPDAEVLPPIPGAPAGASSPAAMAYQQLFNTLSTSYGDAVRLGMGDNFAPSFLSRNVQTSVAGAWCPGSVLVPKDRLYYDEGTHKWWCDDDKKGPGEDINGRNSIDTDNVAQFFIDNKYAAMVPGKHDFYFGTERLRDLARFMAPHGVHMLAANLAIATSRYQVVNAFPRVPARYANHPYKTDSDAPAADLPDMVFPWKREFLIKNARKVSLPASPALLASGTEIDGLKRNQIRVSELVADAMICREKGPSTARPDDVPLPPSPLCSKLVPAETACRAGNVAPLRAPTCRHLYETGAFNAATEAVIKASADETFLFDNPEDRLREGLNHLFCLRLVGSSANDWYCQPFSVQVPFFSWGTGEPTPGGADLKAPFEVVTTATGKVAIFGVVDPDLLSNIGLLNYAWYNEKKALNTTVAVGAADYSLLQALEACNAVEECRSASKILMAQMPYAKAAQLAVRLDSIFDAVISQAEEEHDTGNRNITQTVPDGKPSGIILTPGEPNSTPHFFEPRVSVAVVAKGNRVNPKGEKTTKWWLDNHVERVRRIEDTSPGCPAAGSCVTVSQESTDVLLLKHAQRAVSQVPVLAANPSSTIQDLTLYAMRNSLKTDIALLQNRDFYDADRLSSQPIMPAETQNQLGRILWKNDYVIRLHVTGATLRKIMKQSKKFAELDHDLLSTDVEKGRDLLLLGLYNDPKDPDTYFINGSLMDDTALYSVAATPYLAQGDTGYSDLATPDVPPARRVNDFNKFRYLAGLVCAEIAKLPAYTAIPCDNAELDPRYFDPSHLLPFDGTTGFNTAKHYTTFLRRLKPPADLPKTNAEGRVQQRSFLTISLENLDFSYGGTYINHISQAGTTFAGITATGVTTSGSNSIGADHKLRATYDFRGGTFYLLSDSTFLRTSTTTAPFPTLAANTAGFEGGGTWRFPLLYRPTWLSFQYSSRFEGQLADPSPTKIAFASTPEPSLSSSLILDTPRVSSLFGRAGLRIDHADTYIETGVEEVDSRGVLSQYVFSTLPGPTYCQPSARSQLACGPDPAPNSSLNTTPISSETALQVPGLAKPQINTADFLTAGAYFNFNIKFPLWSRRDAALADQSWYFTLTNKGDFYFNSHSDTTTQTRYLDKFTPAFSIPIYGKLMLTPKVDFILYENKINRNHFRSAAPSLSISYSFKKRVGMDWLRPLRYGAITTTPAAAGTAH